MSLPTPQQRRLDFPPGFLWGAATSAHQTEGNNSNSDWWASELAGKVPHRSGDACDSWNQYPHDIELLQTMGLNTYRLSIEWARVEPEPGQYDLAVLQHYRQLLEKLHAAGIEPIVTLQHFTLPAWVARRGGWANPGTVRAFQAYAARMGREFGDLVRWWVTINEPNVAGLYGHWLGQWPPHREGDLRGWFAFLLNCMRGHAAARRALRSLRPDALVSMAFHLNVFQPNRDGDRVERMFAYVNEWLWQRWMLAVAGRQLDWIGVNYYYRVRVGRELRPRAVLTNLIDAPAEQEGEFADNIYAPGLYEVLMRVDRAGKPVIITENGISDSRDALRGRYLEEHLEQAHRAIRAGVDLRGYTHWSLMDNFEWSEGYSKHFGLCSVDFESPGKERKLRRSALLYRDIARANAVHPRSRN